VTGPEGEGHDEVDGGGQRGKDRQRGIGGGTDRRNDPDGDCREDVGVAGVALR